MNTFEIAVISISVAVLVLYYTLLSINMLGSIFLTLIRNIIQERKIDKADEEIKELPNDVNT